MIKKFAQILIDKNASVKEAMKQLDKTAEKILFVIEEKNKLFGSLTDGDIRRWILNGGEINEKVENVCYRGTFYVEKNYSLSDVKKEMKKRRIGFVPVVNSKRTIVEILVWDEIFGNKILRKTFSGLDAEIVIMAGGKGTRLDPFTKILPKALIPINDKTIIEIIIEKFLPYGINEFYLSVNYKASIIKSFFEELNPEYKIKYIEEAEPLGTIGALKLLENRTTKDILLTNCDIVVDIDYEDFFEYHRANNNDITLIASLKQYKIPYGICKIGEGGILTEIDEKPEYDFLVNTGMYLIKNKLIKHIPEGERFDATEFIKKIIELNYKVGIFPISDNSWYDIGEWIEYKKTLKKIFADE